MRMTQAHNVETPNEATNLSLAQEVQRLKTQTWLKENESAIQAYNEDVDSHGAFGDTLRGF